MVDLTYKNNSPDYKFKMFLRFWMDRIPRLILHNQAWNKFEIFDEMTSIVQAIGRAGENAGKFRTFWQEEIANLSSKSIEGKKAKI